MVYFKQKNRTRKSDPHKIGKSKIESHIKVIKINRFNPEDWPWKFLLQLLSLDVLKRVQLTSYTVISDLLEVLGNTAHHLIS